MQSKRSWYKKPNGHKVFVIRLIFRNMIRTWTIRNRVNQGKQYPTAQLLYHKPKNTLWNLAESSKLKQLRSQLMLRLYLTFWVGFQRSQGSSPLWGSSTGGCRIEMHRSPFCQDICGQISSRRCTVKRWPELTPDVPSVEKTHKSHT